MTSVLAGCPADFVEALRCPWTGQSLRVEPAAVLATLSAEGDVPHDPPVQADAALVTADGTIAYPVYDGILCLLREHAFGRNATAAGANSAERSVQAYYDDFGWMREASGVYADARAFEDLREVSREYVRRSHSRVAKALPPRGRFLLDAASGPVQYDDYLAYSVGFDHRVCVDLSARALREARKRLGTHGLYVLGDVCRLPFGDEVFDGVVSLHTIYHAPSDDQPQAFIELHRVLRPGGRAVIVYSWGPGFLSRAMRLPKRFAARMLRGGRRGDDRTPSLYFAPHTYAWFAERSWPFRYELRSWRSVSVPFLRTFVHSALGGRRMLRLLAWMEDALPSVFARFGVYPLIVVDRSEPT